MPVNFPQGNPAAKIVLVEKALREGAFEACRAAGLATSALAKKTLTDLEAVDRGILRASVASEAEQTPAGGRSVVYSGALHAQYVEFGRAGVLNDPRTNKVLGATAAWPPVSVIADWVRRNYKKLSPSGRTKSGKARKPKDGDVRSLTFLIGRKIFRYGIKPRPWLVPSFEQTKALFPAMVYDAASRKIAEAMSKKGSP